MNTDLTQVIAVAEAAAQYWDDEENLITMVAIAGAESRWQKDAGGDSPEILRDAGFEDQADKAKQYNCPHGDEQGYTSWGLWQIFMPVHKERLERLGAPEDDPCGTAEWLRTPENNASAAYEVWKVQGFEAWTTYKSGEYEDYLPQAENAVTFGDEV